MAVGGVLDGQLVPDLVLANRVVWSFHSRAVKNGDSTALRTGLKDSSGGELYSLGYGW